MAKYRCPQKFISLVRQFHDGMQGRVRDNGETSTPLPVSTSVMQGCALTPTMFSIVFSAMPTDAFNDSDVGISNKYGTDSKLFNLRRLQAKTQIMTDIIKGFLFADDCALNTGSEADVQHTVNKFTAACNVFGTKKIEVLHQPAPVKPYVEPIITINGQRLCAVDWFTYLGSTLSCSIIIDDEVNARLTRGSSTYG